MNYAQRELFKALANREGASMASQELEHLIEMVDQLSASDRQQLMAYLAELQATTQDEPAYSDAEIQQMLTPRPRTGREIVEQGLRSGAIGSWADMAIDDPLDWLRQQRQARYQW
jgi:hypothetical protein